MRKLATIRTIEEIKTIPDADKICAYRVDGWWVIDFIDLFKIGDLCIYVEIDSWIPRIPQIEHLYSRARKKFNDCEGILIKTIKLRDCVSQGLLLPIDSFIDMFINSDFDEGQELCEFFFKGNDISELIGIEKYELPIPTELEGQVCGNFPSFIPKTFQDRCQNIVSDIFNKNADAQYEVSMKINGCSFTGYHIEPNLATEEINGVCSRRWDLDMGQDNAHNSLVRMFIDSKLCDTLHEFRRNLAVQGELAGPGILKNYEGLIFRKLFVFGIFDIDLGCYLTPDQRYKVLDELYKLGLNKDMVVHVPVLHLNSTLKELNITDIKSLLLYSDGPSLNHKIREGLVYERMDGQFSFKVVSDKFLIKEEY